VCRESGITKKKNSAFLYSGKRPRHWRRRRAKSATDKGQDIPGGGGPTHIGNRRANHEGLVNIAGAEGNHGERLLLMELLLLLANAAAGIATALDAYNQNG
jgi:hypothetical protein